MSEACSADEGILEWRVYSTKDMVNWTDHDSPLAIESFDWADDRANYNEYLVTVWDIVSKHPKIKNNSHIMFELETFQ